MIKQERMKYKTLKKLEFDWIFRSTITKETIDNFKKERPNVEMVYGRPIENPPKKVWNPRLGSLL